MGFSATTLAEISAGATVVGAGVSAIGAMKQGNAASASAQYNSEVAANNAQIAKQNATYAAQQGEAQTAAAQQKTRAEVGALKANQAAAGIDVNTGSAVDVRSSAAETGQLNAISIRSDAARKAYGYQTDAASYGSQSELDKSESSSDTTAGEMNAGSTLIGGLGSAASGYTKFQQNNSITWDN